MAMFTILYRRCRQRLGCLVDKGELQLVADIVRDVFQVVAVALRCNDCLTPARWAASTFSFNPPMARTRPVRVISPVMATPRLAGFSVRSETSAVTMVTPAEGPSLGMAPEGTWMWMVRFSKASG